MRRIFALLLFCSFGFSARADANLICEGALSTPAIIYLRTLKSAVAAGEVTLDNLKWMIRQPQPVDAITVPRSHKNLSFKQKLRTQIPLITPEQWQLIVQEAQGIERETAWLNGKASEAHKSTEKFWSIFPILGFSPEERVAKQFASSKKDQFIVTFNSSNTFIYNLRTGTRIAIKDRIPFHFADSVDIFESTTGEVFVALVSPLWVTVLKAETGQVIAAIKEKSLEQQLPLLFEVNGVLSLSLGKRNNLAENEAHISEAIFSFPPGQPYVASTTPFEHVVRLRDGHLYGRVLKHGDDQFSVRVRDLTDEKDVLEFEHTNKNMLHYNSALIFDHGPKLLMRPNLSGDWEVYDSTAQKFLPINLSAGFAVLSSLIYRDDQATNLTTKVENGFYTMEMLTLRNGKREIIDLPFSKDGTYFQSFGHSRHIQTLNSSWIYDWEYIETKVVKLHLYNLETKELFTLETPHPLQKPLPIFYNASDDTILVLALDTESQWRVYSVFGPERSLR